ncbi:MAG: hypothetical protein R6U65_11005 [Perlabentimonas sp.]
MKTKHFVLLAALFSLMLTIVFTNVAENISSYIKTNYFDLPYGKLRSIQSQLKTDDVEMLPDESVNVMGKYLSKNVLETTNPHRINLRGNYFWNIYNALPNFVSAKERHTGYNQGARDYTEEDQLMAYSIYRIDRSPENIRRIFEFFKPKLTNLVSPSVYKDLGVESYVQQALNSYATITNIPNYSNLLRNAYNQVDTTTGTFSDEGKYGTFRKFENSAYGFSVQELNQIIAKHLNFDRFSNLLYSPWLSFWMRRHHEGNMKEVQKILKEINYLYYPEKQKKNSKSYGHEVSHLPHKGKIVYFTKWRDTNGENILILSEEFNEEKRYDGSPSSNVELFAYHYANQGDGFRLLNKHTDNEQNCEFENRARFMEGSVEILDNDDDGYFEATFTYRLGCSSELSPDELYLITMENGKSYSIKGTTKVILDSSVPPLGGETDIGTDFKNANYKLLKSALAIWETQQEDHSRANKVRLYQLYEFEKFHDLKFLGVEPFWHINLSFDKLAYFEPSKEAVWYMYTRITKIDGGYILEAERLNSNDFVVISFQEGNCNDGMSDNKYPYTVSLTRNGRTFEGCGRWKK